MRSIALGNIEYLMEEESGIVTECIINLVEFGMPVSYDNKCDAKASLSMLYLSSQSPTQRVDGEQSFCIR